MSRSDRAFKWRQVDPSPNDSPNQPLLPLQDMQAFSSAQPTSGTNWPDGTFLPVELTAGDPKSAKLASDRHLTQAPPETQSRTQTQSSKYMDEMMEALSCRAQPVKLSADMQRLLHNSKPVQSPQELQHRIYSNGSQIISYKEWYGPQDLELQRKSDSFGSRVSSDSYWYRQSTSPAATAVPSVEEEHGLATLGAKLTLNGFGGYGAARAGAQGLLAAGRAIEDLPGLACGEPPSIGTLRLDVCLA